MSSTKQIEADRLNARKSTGPRSVEGKAAPSANALKTGLDAASLVIRGESAAEFEALTVEYHEHWKPVAPEQRALVDSLVYNDWMLRRCRKIEAQIWRLRFAGNEERGSLDLDYPLADVFINNAQHFDRLQRRIDSVERNYCRTLQDLQNLRLSGTPNHPPREPGPAWHSSDSKPAPEQTRFVSPLSEYPDAGPVTVNQAGPEPVTHPDRKPAANPNALPLTLKYRA